ncbi:MAG: AIR synthase-related protein, partial [Anaerolineales bacterium]|nr:AIR synthase-related protein [Anaerolineales bacterium]
LRDLPESARLLLFDPQTSGGLLMAVPSGKLGALISRADNLGQPLWVVGEVVAGDHIEVV